MKYSIHLNVYDGPLDLLCDMISKQKIDIKDISIIEITKQYLAYINMLEAMDLEVTSDFITMATKLLEIKSKYLLFSQRELDEEDPRLELMEQLKEYKKYKKASEVLKDSVDYLNQPYYRNREEIIIDDNNEWECPNCGNKDHNKMNVVRRTCGYLGENFWNAGKTKEIKQRVLHM